MVIFDIRFHPRHWQLGFSASSSSDGEPKKYRTRYSILMVHLLIVTIDFEHYTTKLDKPNAE